MIIPIDILELSEVQRGRFNHASFVHNSCQSMCYDIRNRRYIVGFYESDKKMSALVKMRDLSFADSAIDMTVIDLPLDHCNDLAYCAQEHKIYAVGGGFWVAIVNPDTLQVEKKISLDMVAWSLAMYPNGDWFVFDSNMGRRYKHDFQSYVIVSTDNLRTLVDTLTSPYNLTEREQFSGCWQGTVMLNGEPYMIYNEYDSQKNQPKSFVLMSCEDNSERTFYRAETKREVESADIVNGVMKLVYNNTYRYGGAEWDMAELLTKIIYVNLGPLNIQEKKETAFDLSTHVPTGYQLVSANVNLVKSDKSIRTLPLISDTGECLLRVWKVNKNRIYIRSGANSYLGASLQITGFCRKT